MKRGDLVKRIPGDAGPCKFGLVLAWHPCIGVDIGMIEVFWNSDSSYGLYPEKGLEVVNES